jgi:hypothetical protein
VFAGQFRIVGLQDELSLTNSDAVVYHQRASSDDAKTVAKRAVHAAHIDKIETIALFSYLCMESGCEGVGYANVISRRPPDGGFGAVDLERVFVSLLFYY